MESKEAKEFTPPNLQHEKEHVQEVVRAAHDELRALLRKRIEIMQRIGSVKRTILCLASVFGEAALDEEWDQQWLELKARKRNHDQPGFTKTCRMILMEAESPLTAREVCERVKSRLEHIELRHKDPLASVTTVLNRLAEYGEARMVAGENGRRAWQWVAQASGSDHSTTGRTPTQEPSPQNKD